MVTIFCLGVRGNFWGSEWAISAEDEGLQPALDCGGNSSSRHNHRIVVVDKAENNYPESQSGGLFCRQSCIFGSCSETQQCPCTSLPLICKAHLGCDIFCPTKLDGGFLTQINLLLCRPKMMIIAMQYNDQMIVDDEIVILLYCPYEAILGWLLSQAEVFLAPIWPLCPHTAVWTRIEMCRDFFVKASLTFFWPNNSSN